MKVLSIQPKDIYVTMEFGIHEFKYLLDFLNNSIMDYDGDKNPELVTAADWATNTLYKGVQEVYNDVQGDR